MTRKKEDLVLYRGKPHRIIHVFGPNGSQSIHTGEYYKNHAGWYNIIPHPEKRAQWPSTVSPDDVTDYTPKKF